MDTVLRIGDSKIQHGKESNRVYIMSLVSNEFDKVIKEVFTLQAVHQYTKIFAKVPKSLLNLMLNEGFEVEAEVEKFYKGTEKGFFMAKYYDKERQFGIDQTLLESVKKTALSKSKNNSKPLEVRYALRRLTLEDTPQMVEVYKRVFKTYPFPIHDLSYIQSTMEEDVVYYGIFDGENLVSLASSEIDYQNLNAEMTDFATLPEYRGSGFGQNILEVMEQNLVKEGIYTAYTIARAVSYGMNCTFSKSGYLFAGTLINNTQISGTIESMNVWYKNLG